MHSKCRSTTNGKLKDEAWMETKTRMTTTTRIHSIQHSIFIRVIHCEWMGNTIITNGWSLIFRIVVSVSMPFVIQSRFSVKCTTFPQAYPYKHILTMAMWRTVANEDDSSRSKWKICEILNNNLVESFRNLLCVLPKGKRKKRKAIFSVPSSKWERKIKEKTAKNENENNRKEIKNRRQSEQEKIRGKNVWKMKN